MGERSDVVVVGGGILGTSLAHALARDSVAVTLLEAQSVGSGITLGPLLGDLLAEEIVREKMPAMLAPYRYERFEAR